MGELSEKGTKTFSEKKGPRKNFEVDELCNWPSFFSASEHSTFPGRGAKNL